ncbi:hypothetical protein HYX17_01030 [Candidatus Woesearchaeota archaeon]|nr:hypothetical protein [Candidatus Woesearchaeota archaeon]
MVSQTIEGIVYQAEVDMHTKEHDINRTNKIAEENSVKFNTDYDIAGRGIPESGNRFYVFGTIEDALQFREKIIMMGISERVDLSKLRENKSILCANNRYNPDRLTTEEMNIIRGYPNSALIGKFDF